MRVGAIISNGGDDFLKFLQQYGVTDVVGGFNTMHEYARKFPPDAGDRPGCHWDYLEIVQLRERVEAFGMKLASLENPPTKFLERCLKTCGPPALPPAASANCIWNIGDPYVEAGSRVADNTGGLYNYLPS